MAHLGGMVFGYIYLRGFNPWDRFKNYLDRRRLNRLKRRFKIVAAVKTTSQDRRFIDSSNRGCCDLRPLELFPRNQKNSENHHQDGAELPRAQPIDILQKDRRERQDKKRRRVDQR